MGGASDLDYLLIEEVNCLLGILHDLYWEKGNGSCEDNGEQVADILVPSGDNEWGKSLVLTEKREGEKDIHFARILK